MAELTFTLADFEGPLDLLLFLIQKSKMDLHDIPILQLIEQYLSVIQSIEKNKAEISSEFIVMASRLVRMKSYLLLPKSEEGERLKQELTGELIEYETCKRVAAQLGQMAQSHYHVIRPRMIFDGKLPYDLKHSPRILADSLNMLGSKAVADMKKLSDRIEPLVVAPFISVSSRVFAVLRGILRGRTVELQHLFGGVQKQEKSKGIATFLAVLELIRSGRIMVEGEQDQLILNRNKGMTNEP